MPAAGTTFRDGTTPSSDCDFHMTTPDLTPARPRGRAPRVSRTLAGVLLASVLAGGVLVAAPQPAAAQRVELAVNELAPEITSAAGQAMAALHEWQTTGEPHHYRDYVWHRTIAARHTARQLGYGELDMIRAWSSTPIDHQRAVLAALTQLGVPYRSNTSRPGEGFDCSGLTTFAWAAAGRQLPRNSSAQINEAAGLSREQAKAGDLVQYPGHVMLYLGVGDAIVHSVMTGRTVELDTISERRTNSVRFGDPTV